MLAGDFGQAASWAMRHMINVGTQFDAADFVDVSQAHMMGDAEAVGDAGATFLEGLADSGARVRIPMLTDPRGVDLSYYKPLHQTEAMATLERRITGACTKLGILMTDTCICYQTISPPVMGDHVAYGDTGVVIYTNSVLGACSNFEGGPSALAAGLTGRTPRYGLHLPEHRRGTDLFDLGYTPRGLFDWSVLGAIMGRRAGSYWRVPVITGISDIPTSDEMKHFGAAMASYGSVPLFHIVGVTPEARRMEDVFVDSPPSATRLTRRDHDAFVKEFSHEDAAVDVVVFAAPQLSLSEVSDVVALLDGRHVNPSTALIVCTSPSVAADCDRLGLTAAIKDSGGVLLRGTCFYQQFAREMAAANGWHHLLSNSAKIVNILGGYGYCPSLATMEACVNAAIKGAMQ